MKKMLGKKMRQNKAFTMVEMMIVVAITVVLLSVSIIGISRLATDLKMAELDAYAKVVYMEAQNQLGIVEVEGGLGTLHDDIKATYPDSSTRFLGNAPGDYDTNNSGVVWKQMCYLTKDDNLSAKLIPFSSDIYNNAGSYLIEFNPQTGDIYGVFYWETDENFKQDGKTLYESICGAVGDRSKAQRADAMIGYYGGIVADDLLEGNALGQHAELINGEELYLKVSFDNQGEFLRYYREALTVTLEFYRGDVEVNEESKPLFTKEMDLSNVVQTFDSVEFYMLLDSMQDGKHFDDIVNDGVADGNKLVPGEDFQIVVKSYFAQGGGMWSSVKTKGNSLFGYGTIDETIYVSSVRHLMNLNETYFKPDLDANETKDIVLASTIDFGKNQYAWDGDTYKGAGNANRPIQTFAPIKNEVLLKNNTVSCKVDDEGKNYNFVLRNFVVQGIANNVGIFSVTDNVDFKDIYIEDITVTSAMDNVGALVGQMKGGSIENCGVYLSTKGERNGVVTEYVLMADSVGGCTHLNEMEHRYDTIKITGGNNVGGLVGSYIGSANEENQIISVFAAAKVEAGGNNAGGLIGELNNATAGNKNITVTKSYTSGDVIGAQFVGGFIGNVSANNKNVAVEDAYATGDVHATKSFGGFLGNSSNTSYKNCISYGEVYKKGENSFADTDNVGGFISSNASSSNSYSNCVYMIQNAYNTESGLKDPNVIGKKTYNALLTQSMDREFLSYAYGADLYQQRFPFVPIAGQTVHYGDWPAEFVIDTSLAYYERYADGGYGYYCVTTLSDNDNVWVLNTLRDEACVEDGYGLLTKYNLEKIDYQLYIGDDQSVGYVEENNIPIITQGQITKPEDADGKIVRLNQQSKLKFYAVKEYNHVTGIETPLPNGEKEEFVVSNLYLYQLPYDLQCTDRFNTEYFYDRIQITANVRGTGRTVIDGLSYYYCPHFSKTAVNPNVNEPENMTAPQNPQNVYLRSARQLNSLGRYPYYWNERGYVVNPNSTEKVNYIQETDINFSTYVKVYCGQPFDLQAFGEIYSNRPIGDPDLAGTSAQFRNVYDGRSNKIIDYCVDGLWVDKDGNRNFTQFTGLFGEVRGATLKNIVMVVSANSTHENAGLITSSFRITDVENAATVRPWENGCTKRAGLGALVGLVYETSDSVTKNTVTNCVSSGYTVEYRLISDQSLSNKGFEAGAQPLGIAVGGLVGFSMSDMSNCAASNDVVFNMETDYIRDKQGTVFLGGFAGSYYYGTIRDCYSGGTISVDDNDAANTNFQYGIARLRVATFCPGWLDTPTEGKEWDDGSVNYYGVYSYTDVSTDVWNVRESAGDTGTRFSHFIPLVSRMVVCEDSRLGIIGDWIWGQRWSTQEIDGITVRAVGTYHVNEIVEPHLANVPGDNNDSPKKYYSDVKNWLGVVTNGRTSAPITIKDLKQITEANTNGVTYDLSKRASATYQDGSLIASVANFPFPEVIYEADANGNKTENYVHYGNWPTEVTWAVKNFVTYYEKYADNSYEFYYIREDGTVVNTLVGDKTKEIIESGYGVLTIDKASANVPEAMESIIGNKDGDSFTYYLMKFDADYLFEKYGTGLENQGKNLQEILLPYNYTVVKLENGILNLDEELDIEGSIKNLYMNPFYGVALSTSDNLGSNENPLQVRTAWQLQNMGNTNVVGTVIAQTQDIYLGANNNAANLNTGVVFDGNMDEGRIIQNASTAVFGVNNGTITNTKVVASNYSKPDINGVNAGFVFTNNGTISNSSVHAQGAYGDVIVNGIKAYGFAAENNGTISYSYVVGTVNATQEAAGFIGVNKGTISNCYANVIVNAAMDDANAKAAGFAIFSENEAGTANINMCYATGAVNTYNAYGFMQRGTASNAYALNHLNGTNLIGFATADRTLENCHWAYDGFTKFNEASAVVHQSGQMQTSGNRNSLWSMQLMALENNVFNPADTNGYYADENLSDVPFDVEHLGTDYPYPSIGLPHYGDWPASMFNWKTQYLRANLNGAGVFYYEKYKDPITSEYVYGVYAEGFSDKGDDANTIEWMLNSMMKSVEITPESSGYGVFVAQTNYANDWDIDFDAKNNKTDWRQMKSLGTSMGTMFGYDFRHVNEADYVKNYHIRYDERNAVNNTGSITQDEINAARN